MKHRLYIDEVGNASLQSSHDPLHRYLSLTALIMEIKHVSEYLHPKLEELKKKYFSKHHPDDPIILHRKELVNANYPFQELRDSNVRISFE